jgi:adenine-specific DNA-methyltransferase
MDRVPNETADARSELLGKLRDLLPAAFPDGELDAGALYAALELAKPDKPSFSFSWPGIDRARFDARVPTAATLIPDRDASVNWDVTRDILIEGDNLQVLKILKAGYSGSAKLIYMDPPYNTGDTFAYKDDLGVPEPRYLRTSGQIDELGNTTTSKVESGGRKHAPWLTMMFPRLAAARHLLRRDGVILITIDDNEVHHLRLLLDTVFGATNFVGSFVWNGGRRDEARRISVAHDYVVAYARDLQFLKDEDIRWRVRKSGLDEIYAKLEELRAEYDQDFDAIHQELLKWYGSLPEEHPSKVHEHFNHVDERGVYFHEGLRSASPQPSCVFTFKGYDPHPNGWAYDRDRMDQLDRDGRILYPELTNQGLQVKFYLHEQEEWAPVSVFYQDRRAAIKAFNDLMGREIFDYSKDIDVLGRMIHAITGDDDLIIDVFAGSGSTGHAVWKQNLADGKIRHWLLVQAPEPPDDRLKAWRRVFEAGYETVFELAADRLRRAAQQLQEGTFTGPQLGFRVFRARPTNMVVEPPMTATDSMTGDRYVETSLGRTEGEPVIGGTDTIAVAWEVALKASGTRLDARVKELDINGVVVYEFMSAENPDGNRRLFVSLDEFSLATAFELKLTDADTLVIRGAKVDNGTTLTLASRLPSKLILLERVPREASDLITGFYAAPV